MPTDFPQAMGLVEPDGRRILRHDFQSQSLRVGKAGFDLGKQLLANALALAARKHIELAEIDDLGVILVGRRKAMPPIIVPLSATRNSP